MMQIATPVYGQLAALADPTRSRLLLLLEQQPLSVSELCEVVQLPQSTVSRHLKVLGEESLVTARSDGASRVYRLASLDAARRRLWQVVRPEVGQSPASRQDVQRLQTVIAERRVRSAAFFAESAGRWDSVRRELFGAGADVVPLLALLDPDLVVGDLGCGTGQVAQRLAPYVRQVIGVDASAEMIATAQQRLGGLENVEVRQGSLEELPVTTGELDVALLILVLHYIVEPVRVLSEAARALGKNGRVLLVDMLPHQRSEYLETMGHVWQGFGSQQLEEWCAEAGLRLERIVELTPDAQARGPNLFAAVARRLEN
jgi:ArsR family transcriptional regulator